MKKSIIYLLISLIGFSACQKKSNAPNSTPASIAQSNCMGSVWKYTVVASPAVAVGSIEILYGVIDGSSTTAFDTTLTTSWTKSITINTPLTGTEVDYPITLQVSKLKSIGTTTVSLHIYKNGVEADTPTIGILTGTTINQTSCK
jgi:hypothetical protein